MSNSQLNNQFNNQRGFTILEALVAMGLLGIVFVGAIQGYEFVRIGQEQIATLNTVDNRISQIVANIRSNIASQVISFPASQSGGSPSLASADQAVNSYIDSTLNGALPMAWSNNVDVKVSDCSTCPGRYGYTITAVPGYSGLYKVTVKFTHTDWGNDARIYRFVVIK